MRTLQYIPRATEKAYSAQAQNKYLFFVPLAASKQEIAKRVSEDFQVTVLDVQTTIRKGKKTRFSRGKHAYPGITYRQDHKVAYITLKAGDKIPVFEETTEETKEDKKAKAKNSKTDSKATEETANTKEVKPKKKAAKKETKEEA